MFGKKNAQTSRPGGYKCLVAGCGLVCADESSLKRHVDWAHPTAKSPGNEQQTVRPESQSR